MKLAVKNLQNQPVREIEVPDAIFAYPFKRHLLHTAVQCYLAGLRAGTHKTKTRAEVSGAGKKLWKQKGTGRARMGSLRSPLWRHGGTVHGPRPRSYAKALSIGEKKNALKAALSQRAAGAAIVVVDAFALSSHKTKELEKTLRGLGVEGKALIVDRHGNENLDLAARNNPRLKTVDALGVNVYDVVDRPQMVVSEAALLQLVEVLAK
jgi:large subunit ribosomal protein L4